MYKFRLWLHRYSTEITWFLIGWLVTTGIDDLVKGHYFSALVAFFFAFMNYQFSKR